MFCGMVCFGDARQIPEFQRRACVLSVLHVEGSRVRGGENEKEGIKQKG